MDYISLSLSRSLFLKTCLPCFRKKRHHEGEGERQKRKSQLGKESYEDRRRLNGIFFFKKRSEGEILSEKGRGVYHPLMAPAESGGPGFISSVCHRLCGDSCSHQHQPRGIQNLLQGKMREEKPKSRASPLPFPFAVRPRNQKRKTRRRLRAGGVTVNGTESMTVSSHSSVPLKQTASHNCTENKSQGRGVSLLNMHSMPGHSPSVVSIVLASE